MGVSMTLMAATACHSQFQLNTNPHLAHAKACLPLQQLPALLEATYISSLQLKLYRICYLVSADSLPSIKATAGQQSPPAARGCSIKPVFHVQPGHSPRASAQQQQQSNVQQAKQQAQALAHQPLTSIAAAAAAHQQQQLSVQIPTSSSITHASNPVSPQRSQTQQRLQSSLQEHLQQPCSPTRQSTAASTSPLGGRAGSRRCSSPAKSQSKLQEEAEEDPFLAQRRLHQLPGLENVCTSSAEAEAGRRIMALPHVLCRAANGELYKMETG